MVTSTRTRDRLVENGAIVVGRGLAAVGAVRHRGNLRPHRLLGTVHHFVHAAQHGVPAVTPQHGVDAVLGELGGGDHRVAVDLDLRGEPHVVVDQRVEVLVRDPALDDLQRRDAEAFGDDVIGIGEVTAGERSAGILHVPAHHGEKQQFIVEENRTNEAPVGQMTVVAAMKRIVGQDDVPRVEVVLEYFPHRLDGELRAEKLARQAFGHGNGGAVGRPYADRKVLEGRHQVALGGAGHHPAHLAAERLEPVPHRRQRHRVYRSRHGRFLHAHACSINRSPSPGRLFTSMTAPRTSGCQSAAGLPLTACKARAFSRRLRRRNDRRCRSRRPCR